MMSRGAGNWKERLLIYQQSVVLYKHKNWEIYTNQTEGWTDGNTYIKLVRDAVAVWSTQNKAIIYKPSLPPHLLGRARKFPHKCLGKEDSSLSSTHTLSPGWIFTANTQTISVHVSVPWHFLASEFKFIIADGSHLPGPSQKYFEKYWNKKGM